jgi:hypothetical protein
MTNQDVIKGKLELFKGNLVEMWGKLSANDFELPRQIVRRRVNRLLKSSAPVAQTQQEDEFRFNESAEEDLPLRIHHDWQDKLYAAEEDEDEASEGGIKYSISENNPLSVGAEKVEQMGLDKFGDEDDTFDPDEADEHQNYHDRKQNSDLSQRYST